MSSYTSRLGLMVGGILASSLFVAGGLPIVHAQPSVPEHAASWEFVGNSQCKMCHNSDKDGAQFSKWQDMGHAKAIETLKSDAAQAIATEKGLTKPAHEAPECLQCHVTAYDFATESAPSKIKIADGVQCESCHGPASEHLKDAKTLKFKPAAISEIDIRAHVLRAEEATCRACHNDSSPTWKDDRYTLESGETVGFDFAQALAKISHAYPEGLLESKYDGKYPTD